MNDYLFIKYSVLFMLATAALINIALGWKLRQEGKLQQAQKLITLGTIMAFLGLVYMVTR